MDVDCKWLHILSHLCFSSFTAGWVWQRVKLLMLKCFHVWYFCGIHRGVVGGGALAYNKEETQDTHILRSGISLLYVGFCTKCYSVTGMFLISAKRKSTFKSCVMVLSCSMQEVLFSNYCHITTVFLFRFDWVVYFVLLPKIVIKMILNYAKQKNLCLKACDRLEDLTQNAFFKQFPPPPFSRCVKFELVTTLVQ